MTIAKNERPENLDIFRHIADGDFGRALHLADSVALADPENKVAVHALARLEEIQATIPYPEDYSSRFPPPTDITEYPAFIIYQAEILAELGDPRAALIQLNNLRRRIPRLQSIGFQMARIHGKFESDDDAFYDNLLDVSAHIPRNNLDEVWKNTWLHVQESPFSILADCEKGRIFSSCATYLPFGPGGIACWIPHLPENDYLILTDWGASSYLSGGFWKALIPEGVRSRVCFLSNETETHEKRLSAGLNSALVNNNCWLDENKFTITEGAVKNYDAVYTARAIDCKRLHLAKKVKNLALVHSDPMSCTVMIPSNGFEQCKPAFKPDAYLNHIGLSALYNESRCGLMLSRTEGACFTASEYMLCGIPVVSTESEPDNTLGGRQAWLSPDNSIYCAPTSSAVAEAVDRIIDLNLNPADIRNSHISKMVAYRNHFQEEVLLPLLQKIGYRGNPAHSLADVAWRKASQGWKFRMENTMKPLKEILAILQSREV